MDLCFLFAWHGSSNAYAPPIMGIIANPSLNMQLRRFVLQQLQPPLSPSCPSYRSRCLQCVATASCHATQRRSRRSFATCNVNRSAEIQPRQHLLNSRQALSKSIPRTRPTYSPSRSYASIPAEELQFGQPVHETHPHLLRAGESKF